MGELHLKECLIFLDDILFFTITFERHCKHLERVFQKLAENGLKLKPSKCEHSRQSLSYLGHIISEDGISKNPEKISAVVEWPPPTNVKELRQFLGFIGYYRRFVKDFAKIISPLNSLLKGHETTNGRKQKKLGGKLVRTNQYHGSGQRRSKGLMGVLRRSSQHHLYHGMQIIEGLSYCTQMLVQRG